MKITKGIYLLLMVAVVSCKDDKTTDTGIYNESSKVLTKIALGSCGTQLDYFATQPVRDRAIFTTIVNKKPDLYIAGGDNLYADLIAIAPGNKEYIELAYKTMWRDPDFTNLRINVPIIATWDDHDYGQNDGVSNNPVKNIAKTLFLQYWKIPEESPRHTRKGIYDVYYYGPEDKRVQVILLDLRTFQSPKGALPLAGLSGYPIITNPDRTMLGDEQWAWLKEEFKKPAKIRLVMSSLQFSAEYSRSEGWAVFPLEMEKMYNLIKETRAEGVVFMSGDVHYSDLNKRSIEGLYPLYDFTSSGLTHKEGSAYPSIYRIQDPFVDLNFGLININWGSPTTINFEIYNKAGDKQREKSISLDELKF
jgi:alkaline phosphatase D